MREEDLLERVRKIGAALRCDGDPDACARSKTCPYHSGHVDHIGFGLGCDWERLGRDAAEALEAMGARLAAYEDTGLEPEDIKKTFNEEAVLKLAAQALGTTPERLRELVKAQDEGRVLPDGSGWFVTSNGKKLTVIMDINAVREAEAALGGGGDG